MATRSDQSETCGVGERRAGSVGDVLSHPDAGVWGAARQGRRPVQSEGGRDRDSRRKFGAETYGDLSRGGRALDFAEAKPGFETRIVIPGEAPLFEYAFKR